jgi:hypothetical protein
MAKDTFWFKHDYNARNDEKILELRSELGAEGYGVYWMLVESMAETDNGGVKASLVGGLSHGFGVAKSKLSEIITFCLGVDLLFEKEGYLFSNRMLKHKEERKFFSDMGKEGAERKKEKYRGAKGGLNRGEEIRGEKKITAVAFENNFAVFPDGSKQELGQSQILRLKLNDIQPNEIIKGYVPR